MSLKLQNNSGKAKAIELEKEIEPSATEATLVTAELVFEAKAKTPVKILVGGNEIGSVNPGEPVAASTSVVTFEVEAGQKYEIKKATLLKEALVSAAPQKQSIASADVEGLLAAGREAAREASVNSNEELRKKNARILSI